MALIKDLMGAGLAPLAAKHIVGTVTDGITAAGSSSQANSTALYTAINNVEAGAANTGVRLPAGQAGDTMVVGNSKADTLFIYPPTGGTINGGSTNAKVDILTLHGALCVCVNSLDWIVVYNT
jgi:hypothetical protein